MNKTDIENRIKGLNEYMLSDKVVISINGSYTDVTETAVYDFMEFLQKSMRI